MRKLIFPIILGLGGVAVLMSLGFWQMHRLDWKEAILADIDARMTAAPMEVPAVPDPEGDAYRAVALTGTPDGPELHVLVSGTAAGTGYRVITALILKDGRRVMLDKGLLALDDKAAEPPVGEISAVGNLIWPDDKNSSTPDPDLPKNIWFARNVPDMAAALGTEPVMVVARNMTPPDPRLALLPVDAAGIKNDHWQYAVTWFLLAAVWAVMSLYLIRQTMRPRT